MRIYTIKDIAQLAGVSVTTVSRVLNHRPDVNRETRERVEQVMAECHFVGNANARGLKQSLSEGVAVILRGRENPFLNALVEAVLQYAQGYHAPFLTEFIDEKADEFQTALRLCHEKRTRGVLFLGSRIDERAAGLKELEVPMVFTTVSAENAGLPRASSVFVDDRAMGRQAMRTLLAAGHTRLAVFGGARLGSDSLALRFAGAMDAMREAGVPFEDSRYVETRFSLKDAYDAARGFFAVRPDTTAVFAMSDTVAMGVIRALRDIGKSVPEDVSVIGFDGIEMGKYFIPRLTTIEQPIDEMARQSVALMMAMLDEGAPNRHICLQGTLRRRETVG